MEVQKLCKSYDDRPVLQNVSFTAENGVTALWGPSGAGKTTLLRILMGLEVPDSGTLSGTDVRWSAVFQEERLLPGWTPWKISGSCWGRTWIMTPLPRNSGRWVWTRPPVSVSGHGPAA